MDDNVSRRMVMGWMGVGAVATTIADAELAAGLGGEPAAAAAPGPLSAGATLDQWTVLAVHPMDKGALPITLRGRDGREWTVEVLARDPSPFAPRPPAQTAHLALHIRNGGNGWAPTTADQEHFAEVFAAALDESGRHHIPGLMTMSERLDAYPELTEESIAASPDAPGVRRFASSPLWNALAALTAPRATRG
jgi:hypothetical protein